MKIACLGGGPAGLYFALTMKRRDPSHEVTVYERNRAGDTFGWGVVFSDETMDRLRKNDPESATTILDEFAHWDDIEVYHRGHVERSSGHGFCGIGRKRLLNILQDRAAALGVNLVFEAEMSADLTRFADCDLIIASDGVNSKIRNAHADHFGVDLDQRANRFIWLGVNKRFDAFTFAFEQRPEGWIWAHAYSFDAETSTFIVECDEQTFRNFGFEGMTQEETCARCEEIFAAYLDGAPLMTNARHLRGSAWLNFPRIICNTWRLGNVVLMGDAAHTAHFSIGSGTKLALEDAIALADALQRFPDRDTALQAYEDERKVEVLKIQNAARNSTEWFETLDRYLDFEPMQFSYSLLTRSQRVSHENLRARDPAWLARAESWFAARATGRQGEPARPPMFAPFRLRDMELANRLVVSPMSMYSAKDGLIDDFHLVHYGARAQGGAGLVYTEMTDVSPEGRITPGCAGLYTDAHEAAWRRIVDYVHAHSDAKICLQIGHSGPKGATRLGWEGNDEPLPGAEQWEILAPSAIPWKPGNPVPRAMERADFDRVLEQHVAAVARAEAAGFDMIELHCAHGYLLSAFITPLTNRRTDEYGGSLENRLRFPLAVFAAMRAAWPQSKPMAVRISATDWVGEEGVTPGEAVKIAKAFAGAGVDVVDVSAGQTTPNGRPVYGRMFQTPFADRVRNEAKVATMAVGNITDFDQANSILLSGRADLVCLARPHLLDPSWTLRAAAAQGWKDIRVPPQYLSGWEQAQRLAKQGARP